MNRLIRKADDQNNTTQTNNTMQTNNTENIINQPADQTNQNINQNINQNTTQNTDKNSKEKIAIDLLERIGNSVDDIKDSYYSLLDNLNAINESYPNLYTEFKQIVKLPNQNDVKEIVQLQSDVKQAIGYFDDPNYLKGFIK